MLLPAGRLSAVLDGTLVVQARASFTLFTRRRCPGGAGCTVASEQVSEHIAFASLVVEDVTGAGKLCGRKRCA